MTIGFTDLFTKLGLFLNVGNQINTSAANIKTEIEDAVQGIDSADPIEQYQAIIDAADAIEPMQASLGGVTQTAVLSACENLIVEIVDADNALSAKGIDEAIDELITQMEANSESLDASTVTATPSYGGGNVGDGVLVTSTKRGDGRENEHAYAEDIEFAHDSVQFNYEGEESETDKLNPDWPKGSGTSGSYTPDSATSGTNLLTGDFEEEDENAADLPEGWIMDTGDLGTTLKVTPIEVQTVIISGTPTSGWYTLTFTNRDSDQQTTAPLPFDADEGEVEDALRALTELENVTVSTSGTSPNYTHTVTFTGVPNPGQLTSTEDFDTGSIAHATSTAGLDVAQGGTALEFDSNGAELTEIYHRIEPTAKGQYAFHTLMRADVVPAAGVITVDLVDGINGSVIADDQSTNNSFTIDCTALTTSWESETGVFRLPTNLPAIVYVRVRISTAVSSGTSIFIDEMALVAMQEAYTGGPSFAIFDGRTDWVEDDTITVAVTNNREGAIHEWLNRLFDLMEDDTLFPTDTGGSETQADSLIA